MRKLFVAAPLACLLVWFVLVFSFTDSIIAFMEGTVSPDKHIEQPVATLARASVYLFVFALSSTLFLWNLPEYTQDFSDSSWFGRSEILLVCCLCLTHLVSYVYRDLQRLYSEDALLETMTAVFAITAGFVLIYTQTLIDQKNARYLTILIGAGILLFGFEEISWGQRIFGIESPEFFQQHNLQKETTLHNFFNPILSYATSVFNVVVALCFRASMYVARLLPSQLEPLVRNRNCRLLSFVFLFLAAQCLAFGGELSEEVLSVLMLSSSLRLLAAQDAS